MFLVVVIVPPLPRSILFSDLALNDGIGHQSMIAVLCQGWPSSGVLRGKAELSTKDPTTAATSGRRGTFREVSDAQPLRPLRRDRSEGSGNHSMLSRERRGFRQIQREREREMPLNRHFPDDIFLNYSLVGHPC